MIESSIESNLNNVFLTYKHVNILCPSLKSVILNTEKRNFNYFYLSISIKRNYLLITKNCGESGLYFLVSHLK